MLYQLALMIILLMLWLILHVLLCRPGTHSIENKKEKDEKV
jgi:hypothetical protein